MKQVKSVLRHYDRYSRSFDRELSDVYGTYSVFKERAYSDCLRKMAQHNGYDGRIVSHNSNIFTFGFRFVNADGERCYCHITPTRCYYTRIDD